MDYARALRSSAKRNWALGTRLRHNVQHTFWNRHTGQRLYAKNMVSLRRQVCIVFLPNPLKGILELPYSSSRGRRIRIHRRATRVGAFEVFEAAHVALRTLLAFSQPVNCIFWPIEMLNWLVAASKLHKHRETCCTAEWPFYSFLILCRG